MSADIVIIDYKMGNLRSVQKAFEKIGAKAIISNDRTLIRDASKIVLPGVGAFKDAMRNLETLGLIDVLNDEVIGKRKYFLGICLGMQLIARKSYEFGETQGLGWMDAEIVRFDFSDRNVPYKIPHVGWNSVAFAHPSSLFQNIPDQTDFYFVHSYYFKGDLRYSTGMTEYGIDFISAVQQDNIFAVQFHPEKSQTYGLELLKNFLNLESGPAC